MATAVPDEVATIATKYNFNWTENSFQQDILSLRNLIKNEINKEMKLKQGSIRMRVSELNRILESTWTILYLSFQKAITDRKQLENVKGSIEVIDTRIEEMLGDVNALSVYACGK